MMTGEDFLLEFHRKNPSATPRSLGWGRLATGESSYEYLAAVVGADIKDAKILDLACGDGHLVRTLQERIPGLAYVGVDISKEDLAHARACYTEPTIEFRSERAQAMSLEAESVDYVLCHLALMLLDDLDTVVREVARVLVPGGVFAAVIGGPLAGSDAFSVFARLFGEACARGEVSEVQFGDPRVHSAEGVKKLFSKSLGFGSVEVDDRWLILDAGVDRVWASLALTYNLAWLTSDARLEFEQRFRKEVAGLVDDDGTLAFRIGVRRIVARRTIA